MTETPKDTTQENITAGDTPKKPTGSGPMATAVTFGQHLTDYAHKYGAVAGVALAGILVIGIVVKKIIKKNSR